MSSTKAPIGFNPTALTTGTNNAVVSGNGVLHGIIVSALGTTPTITIYDALTVTGSPVIASYTPVVGMNVFDMFFATGLTIVIGGTGNTNITTLTAKANTL